MILAARCTGFRPQLDPLLECFDNPVVMRVAAFAGYGCGIILQVAGTVWWTEQHRIWIRRVQYFMLDSSDEALLLVIRRSVMAFWFYRPLLHNKWKQFPIQTSRIYNAILVSIRLACMNLCNELTTPIVNGQWQCRMQKLCECMDSRGALLHDSLLAN